MKIGVCNIGGSCWYATLAKTAKSTVHDLNFLSRIGYVGEIKNNKESSGRQREGPKVGFPFPNIWLFMKEKYFWTDEQ